MKTQLQLIQEAYLQIGIIYENTTPVNEEVFEEEIINEEKVERPIDSVIANNLGSLVSAGQRQFKSETTPNYEKFKSDLLNTHNRKVLEVKNSIKGLGNKVSTKFQDNDGRLTTFIHSGGHPVAEVTHYPNAKNAEDYNKWDVKNKFTQVISRISSKNIQMHKEHNEELKKLGVKEKKPFTNSNVIVTDLGKSKTHFIGHGSAGSIKTSTPSLISKIVNGEIVHEKKNSWNTYD